MVSYLKIFLSVFRTVSQVFSLLPHSELPYKYKWEINIAPSFIDKSYPWIFFDVSSQEGNQWYSLAFIEVGYNNFGELPSLYQLLNMVYFCCIEEI